jgi:hypothetical protein
MNLQIVNDNVVIGGQPVPLQASPNTSGARMEPTLSRDYWTAPL